ncbi:MAG: plasmid mobilization relaxosome protein MobC [Lachnospiraceae bacterium]|nr:plasmid mobilization relaxosome protein MobC [Lachnospiraceae bacterium]
MQRANRKRNRAITIRMNDREYALLQKKVAESDLSQQAYIISAVCNVKISSSNETSVLKDISKTFADHERQIRGMATNVNQMAHVANGHGIVPSTEELKKLSEQIREYREESEKIWQSIRSSITQQNHTEQ